MLFFQRLHVNEDPVSSPVPDPMFAHTKDNSPTVYEDSDEFSAFTTPDAKPLSLTTDIKQEVTSDHSSNGVLLDNNNDVDVLLADYTQANEAGNGSPLVENGFDQSHGFLKKKLIEVNNNDVNALNGIDASSTGRSLSLPSNETYPPDVSISQHLFGGKLVEKDKKSHHDQFAEFLLQKQVELHNQQQDQELLRQQQLEVLKQEILRMSQLTAQAQQAQAAAEESAISQALQAQQPSLPRLTADTVQGIINNLPSNTKSSDIPSLSNSLLSNVNKATITSKLQNTFPKQITKQTGQFIQKSSTQQPQSLVVHQQQSENDVSNIYPTDSNVPHSPTHSTGPFISQASVVPQSTARGKAPLLPSQSPVHTNVSSVTQQSSVPRSPGVSLVPPQSPVLQSLIHSNVSVVPPQSPMSVKQRVSSHLPSAQVSHSQIPRSNSVVLPHSPTQQQFQSTFPRMPTSPLMQAPPTSLSRPRIVQPQTSEANDRTFHPTSPQTTKSLLFPSNRPKRLLQPKQVSVMPQSPTATSQQRPTLVSVNTKVTRQSILNTSHSQITQNQVIYQQSQQSLLSTTPFSGGVNGPRLPTDQVRPMPPNSPVTTSLGPSTSTLKSPVKVESPTDKKTKAPKSKTSPKATTPSKQKKTPPPKSKVTQPKSSKSKRKKPTHLVSPMSKTVLPQNGISITHEPVSPQALSKLQRSGPPPLLQVFPQPTQASTRVPSPSGTATTTAVVASASSLPSKTRSPSTPVPQTPSPAASLDDGELISGLDDDSQKPSESTKKIIKALNEKYSRKSSKRSNNATNEKVSINELNDIIKHSIDKKPPAIKDPDGFVYDPTDICRGLGNMPLKPSLLGNPNVNRFGVPRFHKRVPWQKFPLLHARPLLSDAQPIQKPQEGVQTSPKAEPQTPTQCSPDPGPCLSSESQIITQLESNIEPSSQTATDTKIITPQLHSPVQERKPLSTAVMAPSTPNVVPVSTQGANVVTAVPVMYTRSNSLGIMTTKVTTCTVSVAVSSCTVTSSVVTPPVMPQSAPVRLTSPAFPRIPTPTASPTSSLSSAPERPSISAPQTPTANNCPTEPFGSMSLESLTRPPIPNHRPPKGTTSSSPVQFSHSPTYNPDTGSNVVVIMPDPGYNCPVPNIPLPQASTASIQPGTLPRYHADLKSPDSGFNESCASPLDVSVPVSIDSIVYYIWVEFLHCLLAAHTLINCISRAMVHEYANLEVM